MGQLELGKLRAKLADAKKKAGSKSMTVRFDWGNCGVSGLGSYRGYYEHVAIEPSFGPADRLDLDELIAAVDALYDQKMMHGYKGGNFPVRDDCLLWVAPHGETSETTPVDVHVYVSECGEYGWVTIVTETDREELLG